MFAICLLSVQYFILDYSDEYFPKEICMQKKKYSNKERIRYAFDNVMSKGPMALISWLALITILV